MNTMQTQAAPQPPEIIKVKSCKVACDGGGALGHPTIYLAISQKTNFVDCPYCDRRFALEKT